MAPLTAPRRSRRGTLCKLASELEPGERASLSHTVTDVDLELFAAATGDLNPIHFDQAYAEATFFRGRIAHGMLCGGLISAVIANRLPGLGTIYVSQSLRFLAPVCIGETITAEVEVLGVEREKNLVRLHTTCTKGGGEVVVDGEAVVEPPRKRPPEEVTRAIHRRSLILERALSHARKVFAEAAQPLPGAES